MEFLKTIKNALYLVWKRDWHEFYVRARIVLGQIDLKKVTTDELHLPGDRSHSYSDSGGPALERVLGSFAVAPRDAIVDFGCGKGGALITLAKFPFAKITGVELSAELAEVARRNLKKLNIDNVQLICCDAAHFTELDVYTYFYFFNPFPCNIMRLVMDNIETSVTRLPRKAHIIYLNPVCHDEIVSNGIFTIREVLDHPAHKYFVYSNFG